MLLFRRRPRQPKGFSRRAAAGKKLDPIPPLWQDDAYKAVFTDAQHDKCGYCETFVGNHPAPIDHHAPKGAVHILVVEGSEIAGLYKVRGRETPEISPTGYHWRALSWDNWLLVCERCNTGWKGSLFPVREDLAFMNELVSIRLLHGIEQVKAFLAMSARRPPHPRRKVTPLLLNPFGPEDPVDHLEFTSRGDIAPRNGSDHGRETIRTCGLHREALRRTREGIAADTFRHIEGLRQAGRDLEKALDALEDLLSLGGEDCAHAGMVRCIVLSRLALRWPELEALVKKHRPSVRPLKKRARR